MLRSADIVGIVVNTRFRGALRRIVERRMFAVTFATRSSRGTSMGQSSGGPPGAEDVADLLRCGLEFCALRALGDPDDARDALQETVARTLEAVRNGTVPSGVRLPAFAYGIMRHVIADILQRRQRNAPTAIDPDLMPASQPSPLEQLLTAEEEATLHRAIAKLGPDDRALLDRCFVHGECVADVARLLGVPAARVRKRKSRALERLRALLKATPLGHTSFASGTIRV